MTTTKNYRAFLVEDDRGTLQRMAEIVRAQSELSLVGMAETYTDASAWLNNNELDVLLTDLGLPDGNGKQLIEQTRKQHPSAEIMVISRFGDENSVVEAIKAGASGYLLKDESEEDISDAIHQLLQGGSPISPAIARYILDFFQNDEISSSNTVESSTREALLTPKEKLVLQYISRGYSNKEIASSLEISPHTVASHIKRIYRKLEVNSRNEAVFEGWRMGELSMHQQQPSSQTSQKDPQQIAQALKEGGKSAKEIMDVLTLVFTLNELQGMTLLQQLEFNGSDIFAAAKNCFQTEDKKIIEHMLVLGFNHEEALQAMLDQM
ncbi:MAG: response regulator transcription factor [Cocleimonas sp.]|nr:response regulator transcription factor [Cocleimonas sp.]